MEPATPMETAPPVYLETGCPDQILQATASFPQNVTLMVLVAEGEESRLESINQTLVTTGFAYAGAMFPGIIFNQQVHKHGVLIVPLPAHTSPVVIDGLHDGQFNLEDLPDVTEVQDQSLFILVDGLSSYVSEFLRRLYGHFGTRVIYLGGGAGTISLQHNPCVFSSRGIARDQAIIIPTAARLHLGVKHGWQRLMGPLIATAVDQNVIKQINWQNAYSVYRDVVEEEAGQYFTRDNFNGIASAYPFGLEKYDAEDIVRDPISVTAEGELICIGEVPENAILYILKGNEETLTESANEAVQRSMEQSTAPVRLSLIMDCVSRYLFLDNEFNKELNCISKSFDDRGIEAHAVGILTLGQISSVGDGYLEFLNKSIVVGNLT